MPPRLRPSGRHPQTRDWRGVHSAGRLSGLWQRVGARTRSALRALSPPLAEGYYDELEKLLLAADLGPAMAARLAEGVRARAPRTREEAVEALVTVALFVMSRKARDLQLIGQPACVLLYGINGAGKTTTAGKLAHRLKNEGRMPLVVAADTYRAAGIEQMVVLAERAGVPHHDGASGADPASVVFDGIQIARKRGNDVVIADTAGRLQTQRNLLEELAKIGRVASKALDGAPYESILVLDAVVGLTSLAQAREFNKAIPMTGLALAKLDSTAKGGAVISIESELDVPVKLAGVGEGIDDLVPFDAGAFVRGIFD
ncbi:MAG TPA: signal recognition particle-docking protein FtsY [Candidatus Dormibacteraeota bacterium]|nr:signal recognition particle-docking protein FtsY [Candidatus Dormibacteraeota bacterium]